MWGIQTYEGQGYEEGNIRDAWELLPGAITMSCYGTRVVHVLCVYVWLPLLLGG